MSVDEATTRRVAHLARVRVSGDQLAPLARELSQILAFAEQLAAVDVTGVEPMTSVTPMRLKMRDDVVSDGNRRDDILANAPLTREGFFAVPKVVE